MEYFIEGMALSFKKVLKHLEKAKISHAKDHSFALRQLDPRQRKVLELFFLQEIITSRDIAKLFGFKPRTSAQLCKQWVESYFLEVVDSSNKGRKYRLAKRFKLLLKEE